MVAVDLELPWDPQAWRRHARAALCADVAPEAISWRGASQGGLPFGDALDALPPVREAPRIARDFLPLLNAVICHRDSQRHGLLYRLLWRMSHGQPRLLENAADVDVHQARELEKSVRRDHHKMKAFVRFRAVPGQDETYIAWFEPQHYIVDRIAPFFAGRFAGMRWSILTPYRSVHWDGAQLRFGEGATRAQAPADDAQESLWRTYYAHIFNPARLNPRMMRQEMPQKYWKHLPEAHALPSLIRQAGARVREMAERAPQAPRRRIPTPAAAASAPAAGSLEALQAQVRACRRCPLWQPTTQAVVGEGSREARVLVIGEQPGDEEDLSGRPLVGPAGHLFARALREAGLDRGAFYITNAVKHFRFEQRGKRRLHRNPEAAHVRACHAWLEQEMALLRPRQVLCLGAVAAQAVLGSGFRLSEEHGRWQSLPDGTQVLATFHPAAILRTSGAARQTRWSALLADLGTLGAAMRADDQNRSSAIT